MNERKSLEAATISSLWAVAQMDPARACALIDSTGVSCDDVSNDVLRAAFSKIEMLARDGRVAEFFEVTHGMTPTAKSLLSDAWIDTDGDVAEGRLAMLHDVAQRRRLASSMRALAATVENGNESLPDALKEVSAVVEAFGADRRTLLTLDQDLYRLLDEMERVATGKFEPTIKTGIEALDAATGGLQRTLTIIGALPGVGKSALMASMVRNMTASGRRVGFFSLEDERAWISDRLAADASRIPVFVLKSRPLSGGQEQRLQSAWAKITEQLKRAVVYDKPLATVRDVVTAARAMVSIHSVEAIFVDHLGEIRIERSDRHDLDIIEVLQELRALSKRYRIPIVVAAHLKRRAGLDAKSVPELTDFAFSSGLERMARVALGLSKGGDNEINVTVLKQTNGPSGFTFPITFASTTGTVDNEPNQTARRNMDEMEGAMAELERTENQ